MSTAEPFRLLASAQDDEWLMIEYEVGDDGYRVGWIRTPETMDRDVLRDTVLSLSDVGNPLAARLPCVLGEPNTLTDDPRGSRRAIRTLEAGETVIALSAYEDGRTRWLYVETEADGLPVWGFMPDYAVTALSLTDLTDGVLTFRDGVTVLGDPAIWEWDSASDESARRTPRVAPGDLWCPGIALTGRSDIREIRLPSALTFIGDEALSLGGLDALRFGGRPEMGCIFYGVTVERMILAADYTGEIPKGEYLTIGAWETEPGNPLYLARDGVLYTADGKTLLRYPNGRPDAHFDVPAGTEAIADYAFTDDSHAIPLTSLSLPIGLKRIGAGAFTGCTRLLSLTVPLTVTELDPTAFATCVSLERLSLPPGLRAEFDDRWALRPDYTHFVGDNGGVTPKWEDEEDEEDGETDEWRNVWIASRDGVSPVAWYRSPTSSDPAGELPSGTVLWLIRAADGRGCVRFWIDNQYTDAWISLEELLPVLGDTLFTVADAAPGPGCAEDLTGYAFRECGGGRCSFSGPDWAWTAVPLDQLVLYRDPDPAGRRLAILFDGAGMTADRFSGDDTAVLFPAPIRIRDVPAGLPLAFVYSGEQCEILAESNGWIRIRTARLEGWVERRTVVEVRER